MTDWTERTFSRVPGIPFSPCLHLHCPRLARVDIASRGLLVQSVELQQLIVVGLLLESLDALGSGLEVSLRVIGTMDGAVVR